MPPFPACLLQLPVWLLRVDLMLWSPLKGEDRPGEAVSEGLICDLELTGEHKKVGPVCPIWTCCLTAEGESLCGSRIFLILFRAFILFEKLSFFDTISGLCPISQILSLVILVYIYTLFTLTNMYVIYLYIHNYRAYLSLFHNHPV